MKKLFSFGKVLLAVAFLAVANNSCTNLDEKLYSQVAVADYFKTDEEFNAALGAAYIKFYGFASHNSIWSDQEVSTDELMIPWRGKDWEDGEQWIRMHQHNYNAKEASFNNSWALCYDGILTCNRLLYQLNAANATKAAQFVPELKTLRAYYYTFLLDMFGNVPIVTDFPSKSDNPENSTRAKVFEFIETELNTNVPLLSKNVDGTTYGRMNYFVGRSILAKLYLNAEVYTGTPQWKKAFDAADEVIKSNKYILSPNFADNFKATNDKTSKENILVIAYDEKFAQGFNLVQMTLHYSSQATFNTREQPWNGYCSLADFYSSFDSSDVRKKGFLVGQQYDSNGKILTDADADANDPDGAPLNFTPEINEIKPKCLRQAGARIGKFEFAAGVRSSMSNDFPLLRLSDIIMTRGEAAWKLSNNPTDAAALADFNTIRSRASVATSGPLKLAPFTTLSAAIILAERGRELFVEAHRRTDQIRLGAYGASRRYKGVDPVDGHLNVFPIPQAQIDANSKLRQNPLY
jgi:starch-binding outer membrane protein, SusD/RagB family